MKKLILSLFVFSLSVFSGLAGAQESQSSAVQANSSQSSHQNSNQNQDKWFYYFGVGIVPQPKFDVGIQSNIDSAKQNNSWAGEYGGVLELPGVYYRVGQSTMLGILTHFIFENYARNYKDHQSLGYDTYNISVSAMTSTGTEPGLGYFARLDLGPCDLIQVDESLGSNGSSYARSYFSGFFEQVAFGYGFQSSSNTRLLSHVNFFYEDVIGHFQTGVSLNIGFLL